MGRVFVSDTARVSCVNSKTGKSLGRNGRLNCLPFLKCATVKLKLLAIRGHERNGPPILLLTVLPSRVEMNPQLFLGVRSLLTRRTGPQLLVSWL